MCGTAEHRKHSFGNSAATLRLVNDLTLYLQNQFELAISLFLAEQKNNFQCKYDIMLILPFMLHIIKKGSNL